MEWKYSAINKNREISLHDCVVTRIAVDGGDLFFEFEDGFWLTRGNQQNPYGKTLRTGVSQLRVTSFEIETIFIHKIRNLIFRRGYLKHPRRTEVELETLVEYVNGGKWHLEFITEYHTAWPGRVLLDGLIGPRPRRRSVSYIDFQMAIQYSDMRYFWNEIRTDREG